jgi:hypothetical protein
MELARAPAPAGDEAPLKTPVVEVLDLISAQPDGGSAPEDDSGALDDTTSQSGTEGGGEDSEEDWENESLYEDALQPLRDEQLRDGGAKYTAINLLFATSDLNAVPDACTLDEALAFRRRLHTIGKAAFAAETVGLETISAKKLCTAFGIMPPAFLEDAPDKAYHPLLAIGISREFSKRQKLPEYNTIDDAVELLKKSKNVIVLTGAGVCIVPPVLKDRMAEDGA